MKPKTPLLPVDDAIALLLRAAAPMPEIVQVDTMHACGRVLAHDVASTIAVPPHDNSAMDGYALRAADVRAAGALLQVAQRIAAGSIGAPLLPGTAARIFTGAPMPPGADAVVMQEQCTVQENGVIINHFPQAGEHVRKRGEDIAQGAVILPVGTQLTAVHIGLAASVGIAQLPVHRALRVALFSTGNELRMPGEQLAPGQIYNSNRFVLTNTLTQLGCNVTDLGIVRDDLQATIDALRDAADKHDVIITCGGVSVGEEDHVKPAVRSLGTLDLWSIAMKPGKPLAFGTLKRVDGSHAHFVGLPGNPVSALLTLLMVVRPFLKACMGAAHMQPAPHMMRADFAWPRPDARREFLRVRINGQGGLGLHANQGSGVLSSCAWASGLVDNPPGQTIEPGDSVRYIAWQQLLH
jgi:molybdopterin molybdotransferase